MAVPTLDRTHRAADVFPMMSEDEYRGLVEDIRANGLLEPIWVNADGRLLDGRNRLKACLELGVTPRVQTYSGDSPVAFVVGLNIHRRHLTTGQRAAAGVKLEPMLAEEARARQLAGTKYLGADLPQGKRAPKASDLAAKLVGTSGRAVRQFKRVAEKAPELAAQVEAGTMALDAAHSEVRKIVAKENYLQRQAEYDAAANLFNHTGDLRRGDFREVLADLEPGSVDAIITDPPYPDEFLPLWADLAKLAARVLRPGAPLIAWSGQYRLQQVLNHLCGPLTYQWTYCLDLPGSNARFRGPNVMQTWKPVIIATNGTWGPHDWFKDRVVSPKKDQDVYEWQQNPDPAGELINRYVPADGLVLDPMMGVGSFGLAALQAGRKFIGVELDEERFNQANVRLS